MSTGLKLALVALCASSAVTLGTLSVMDDALKMPSEPVVPSVLQPPLPQVSQPADPKQAIELAAHTTLQDTGPDVFRGTPNRIEELTIINKDIGYALNLLSHYTHRNILASDKVQGNLTISLRDTSPDEALDKILRIHGFVARQEGNYTMIYARNELEGIDKLDAKMGIRIVKPTYISAQDLSEILTPHLTEAPIGRISATKANQTGIATNSDEAGGDSLATSDVLVIQDYEKVLEKVDRIVEEVDRQPPQVLIEAVILSVILDDEHKMGVNFALLGARQGNLLVSGLGSALNASTGFVPSNIVNDLGKVQGGFAGDNHGLKYGVVDDDFTAFIDLLETVGETTIVASPNVLVLNKQRAEILVGRRIGYRTLTTTETAAVEDVKFLDTGTQLRIRPFVQNDGTIRMEFHPERSSGQINPETQAPDEDTTAVTTNLVVASNTTVAIGGLIEEQQTKSVQQIPLLGSIPYLGKIFRDETVDVSRSELIVLLTPRIVSNADVAEDAARELEYFTQRRKNVERSFPHGMRIRLAERYYEEALAHSLTGDRETAILLVKKALEMQPSHEAAARLKVQLCGND